MKTLDAIDIGFSAVKVLATNGRKQSFPAVVGTEAPKRGFSMDEAKTKGMVITIRDEQGREQTRTVGHTAIKQADYQTGGGRRGDWLFSAQYNFLLCAALSELHRATTTTAMVTGLPLEDYAALADKARGVFLGEHTFRRNGENWQTVTVEDCLVITQPYGTLLDLALADSGKILDNPFATGVVALADIGGVTLNLLVADNLEEVGRWTQGDGLGLLKALDAIARDIKADYPGFAPKAHEVAGWLAKGEFPYQDGQKDIGPYAEKHLGPVAEAVLARMAEVWAEPGRYAAVVLTGGGSVALGRILKEQMNNVYANVTAAQEPVFANVRGYLKLSRRLWELG